MKSIRITIFQALLLIAGVSVVIILGLSWLNLMVTKQYKSTLDLMTTEYRLVDMTNEMALLYKQFAKNTQDELNLQRIMTVENQIRQTFVFLDSQTFDDQSYTLYLGLKNTVESIDRDVNQALTMIRQTQSVVSNTSYEALYQDIMNKNTYIKDNVSALLMSQLQYSNSLQKQIDQFTNISYGISVGALLLMVLGDSLFAWKFSQSLVHPLEELTVTAERIANGDSTLTLSPTLVDQKNEVGRLAGVFGMMTKKLLLSITDLNASNATMLQVKQDIEERNKELQKMNEFMIGRELKMAELKKEIAELRRSQTS